MASQQIFSGKHSLRYTTETRNDDVSDKTEDYSSDVHEEDLQYDSQWFEQQRKQASRLNVSPPQQNIMIKENMFNTLNLNQESDANLSTFHGNRVDLRQTYDQW